MKILNILVNCSNLHTGGGVAVAASFIDCLSKQQYNDINIFLLLSTPVFNNLTEMGVDTSQFSSCIVKDYYGIQAIWKGLHQHFRDKDLVFTVFGPAYYLHCQAIHLCGFALPHLIYPEYIKVSAPNVFYAAMWRCKLLLQSYFFSRADVIVVELDHVKVRLQKIRLFREIPIHIVNNSVHTVFTNSERWAPLKMPMTNGHLRLGIASRNYPHKNISILPRVKSSLLELYGLIVDFYVTFPTEEWRKCDANFQANIINVGSLSLSQCPSFYSELDGVVFPSLLECFSAVPIETMILKKPLFASNLPFIRDVCADNCHYFDPLDPGDIARVIHDYFNLSVDEQTKKLDNAYIHAQTFPSAFDRSNRYMTIISTTMEKLRC